MKKYKHYYLTSESVTEGHPDKVCDFISDSILDACLEQDKESRVAVETFISKDKVVVAGQITSNAKINIENIVRERLKEVGYTDSSINMDYKTCKVDINITKQSNDIAIGVNDGGAGDQGIMFGYATDDSERYIIIKLDEPKYLSALEYVPRQIENNGRIKEGQVLVSMDGKIWTDVATITNWADSPDSKMLVFDEIIKSQYVKLVATENYGDGRDFITATMINLFEDITQKEESETPPDEEEEPGEIPDETLPEDPEEEQKPEENPTPDEEEKPEEMPDETLPEDSEEEQKPEQKPTPDKEQKPGSKPEQEPILDEEQKSEQKLEKTPTLDEEEKTKEALAEIITLEEEQKLDETPDETPTSDEEQKAEETLIQDQGQISNANELDTTVATGTLPKTGFNTIIFIMILVAGTLVIIFYIKMKRNPFKNSKN